MQIASLITKGNDTELDVRLSIKGDKQAFERLIQGNRTSMYRIALSILVNKEDIEDAIQNTIIKSYVEIINTNIDLSSLRPGLKVNEVILTPINTVIKASEIFNGGFYGDKGGYLIYDDKGRKLNYKSGSGEGSQKTKIYNYQLIYSNVFEDTQAINIIPYNTSQEFMQNKNNKNGTVSFDMKEVPININNTTIIDEGRLGEYKITKIDFQKDKTLIYYECSDLLALLSNSKVWIVDNDNKEYAFYEGIVRKEEPGSNKYINVYSTNN